MLTRFGVNVADLLNLKDVTNSAMLFEERSDVYCVAAGCLDAKQKIRSESLKDRERTDALASLRFSLKWERERLTHIRYSIHVYI